MLPLATTTWDDKEYAAIQRVIDSGMFSMGKEVQAFENAFSQWVGSKYAVMVNSGSSANLLAIAALCYRTDQPLMPGDEVVVPAVSWSTTYYPLQQYGLKLKFVDVDIDTLNIDLNDLEKAITEKTKAIFAVNLLGNPIDYDRLNNIIQNRDIMLIEDNCESLGAEFNQRKAGTFGVCGTFSSFFSHHISTMEGGIVVTDDEELFHLMLAIRSHGWTRHLPKENKVAVKSDDPFYESFRFVVPGYNLRPLDMSGALGVEQLKKLPSILSGRRKNAAIFQEAFGTIDGIRIQKEVGESSWFGFSLIVDGGREMRDRLVKSLQRQGVECRPIVAGNFVRNEVVKYLDYSVYGELESSDVVTDSGFFIGNHHFDISNELKSIAEVVRSELAKGGSFCS